MTHLAHHVTFGTNGQIWLSMPTCTAQHRRHTWLRRLHPDGYRDLRAIIGDSATNRSYRADDLAGFDKFVASHAADKNLYVGVATRDGKGRTADHCVALHSLFADLDYATLPEDDARRRLAAFPLPPSAVVGSGNGLHAYWWLDQPINLQHDGAPGHVVALVKALAAKLGSDPGVADVARVLRIPGTLNHKYTPPRPVVLETLNDHEYDIAQFLAIVGDLLPEKTDAPPDTAPIDHGVTVPFRKQLARRWLASQPGGFTYSYRPNDQQQSGNDETYKVCAHVAIGFDLSVDDAYQVMQDWNERCAPDTWPEKELRTIIRNSIKHGKGKRGYKLVFHREKTGRKSIIADSQANVQLALAKLQTALSYDSFALKARVVSANYHGALDDAICRRLRFEIDSRFRFRPSKDFLSDLLADLAATNAHHPVLAYLSALRWDGASRIATWLIDHAGAPDTPYVRAVSALVLIGAVRRVRQPGCKFDEMLILENPNQGTQKSSGIATLCPRAEWFSDDLPLGVDSKQVIEQTAGKWIIEAADLHGFHQREATAMKSFLSRQVDGPVRLAYGRLSTEVPRQFVIVGTTNHANNYLNDSTGNRRFWPVPVRMVNLAALRENRDQLWAEAAHREAAGEPSRLAEELWPDATKEQEERRAVDPWEEHLLDYLEEQDPPIFLADAPFVPVDNVWSALASERANQRDNRHGARIAAIMQRYGLTKKERRRYTERIWTYDNDKADWKEIQRNRYCWVRETDDVPF